MPSNQNANLTIVMRAKDEASKVMKQTSQEIGKASQAIQQHGKAIGAVFAAVGVAGLKMIADSKKLNAQLGQTALGLDMTTDELRDLTLATANVTFPIKEVIKSFDLLTRAGLKDAAAIAKTATAFDTLGDAIGKDASVVTKMLVPAFKAFGMELTDIEGELDKFTWLTRNTTIGLDEFSRMMNLLAKDLDVLNITMDDSIVIMAALEAKGISGRAANRAFSEAVIEAEKGEVSLAEALGLTTEQIALQEEALKGAAGMTQEYADIANTQYSIMDKLKQQFSELTLRMGSALEPMEGMFAAMTALGPVMMMMNTQIGISGARWVAHTVKVWAAVAAHNALKIAIIGLPFAIAGAIFAWTQYLDKTNEAIEKQQELSNAFSLSSDTVTESRIAMGLGEEQVDEFTEAFDQLKAKTMAVKEEIEATTWEVDHMNNVMGESPAYVQDMAIMWDVYKEKVNAANVAQQALMATQDEQRSKDAAARAEKDRLNKSFQDLIDQIEYEDSAAGKLGITMRDIYDAMLDQGYALVDMKRKYEDWGFSVGAVEEALMFMGMTAKEVGVIIGKLTDDIEDATRAQENLRAQFRAQPEQAAARFEELSRIAETSPGFLASPEFAAAEARRLDPSVEQWGFGEVVGALERSLKRQDISIYLDGEIIAALIVERVADEAALQGIEA